MIFRREKRIRFQHCDPAGIVFYPQYFVLFHELQKDWFNEGLGVDYADYLQNQGFGVPTVKVECEFLATNKFGDMLVLELAVPQTAKSACVRRSRQYMPPSMAFAPCGFRMVCARRWRSFVNAEYFTPMATTRKLKGNLKIIDEPRSSQTRGGEHHQRGVHCGRYQ